jgi:DNA-binding IclR family transcriptional regulator
MFARDRQEIGIGEMAQELGLRRSTPSRLAATLAVAGYLEPAREPGLYRLSVRLAALVAAECDVRQAGLRPDRDGRGEHQHLRARLTHR